MSIEILTDEQEQAKARAEFDTELYPQFPVTMSSIEKDNLADWMWEYVNHVFDAGYEQALNDAAEFGLDQDRLKSLH